MLDDVGDLADLLEATDVHPVHLVADAYGGTVALRLAIERPELVRSLALNEPTCLGLLDDPDGGSEAPRVARAIRTLAARAGGDGSGWATGIVGLLSGAGSEGRRLSPAVRSRVLEDHGSGLAEFDDPDSARVDLEAVRGIEIPVLLTVGEASAPFLHRISERLARTLPNASLVTLPGAGPFPQLTHPDLLVGVLGSFLLERNVPTT